MAALLATACSGNKNAYDAVGTFDADEIIVASEVAGEIKALDVNEGMRLEKGMQVGLIDTTQYWLQKRQLMEGIVGVDASIPSLDKQLAPLFEQLGNLRSDRERVAKLLDGGSATRKQMDDINTAVAALEKQIEAHRNTYNTSVAGADSRTATMRLQIEQLDDRLAKSRITSPIDGTVVAKYAYAGELANVGRPLFKVADMDNMYLKAYIASAQLMDLKLGQKVSVRADFGGGKYRDYQGEVTWISDKSEFTPKNIVTSDDRASMVYAVKIAVRNDGYLKIGMYGEVEF